MRLGDKLYNIYYCPTGIVKNSYDILNNYKEDYAGWRFCTNCFDEIISTVSKGNHPGGEARKHIEQKYENSPKNFTVVEE